MHPSVLSSINNNCQDVEAACPSTDAGIKKMWRICMSVYVEYYLTLKKNEILHL